MANDTTTLLVLLGKPGRNFLETLMKSAVRAVAGLIAAFLITEETPRLFYVLIGQRLLKASGWARGTPPPASYAVWTIAVSIVAAVIAGVIAVMIVQRARTSYVLVCGLLLTIITIIRYWSTLFPPRYLDAWPITLSPLIFMPLGAWLVVQRKSRSVPRQN